VLALQGLLPEATYDASLLWDASGRDLGGSFATIYVVDDPENNVIEQDKSNNTYVQSVGIGAGKSPGALSWYLY